ncbi:MAG: divalent metal cation transporter [Pirellulales bacterium]|nr:divalent metal cation transporter [Pirellulales bacterium]
MANESKGLPMTAKWDPEKLQREVAELQSLEQKPFFTRAGGYIKRTGPGLLQSAMTLGAGSATASVVAGASFGYKLLWVQIVAMFLGVMMLAALGNIVLSTGERPYKSFGREIGKTLVVLWALGTIVSSIIWHFPQYGLASGAARDLGAMAQVTTDVSFLKLPDGTYLTKANAETVDSVRAKFEAKEAYAIQADVTDAQWEAAKKTQGTESKSLFTASGLAISFGVGLLILAINIFTVFSYGSSPRGIKIYEWFLRTVIGLIIAMFAIVVASSIGKIDWCELAKGLIGWYGIPEASNPKHITLVLGMLGAAVGINMTFLYPYSILAKGWGKDHKKLARWDLGMSMFLPFALVTSLVIIAMTVTGIYTGHDILREGLKPVDAANSLSGVLGRHAGRIVFDLGLIAMTCSAISTHMVVCGFTLCEMFGLEYTKTRFRIFALAPSIGILGVVAELPFWFPVAASAVCFAMLPIAYLIFYLLNNKESYLGEGMMKWPRREFFNIVLVIALAMATIGSIIQINNRVIKNPKVREFFGATAAVQPEPSPADPNSGTAKNRDP